MEAIAIPGFASYESDPDPVTLSTDRSQDIGDLSHGEPMTKAEEAELREALHVLILSATTTNKALERSIERPHENGNGATNKRVTWLMAIFAMITIMGAGSNFLTS